MFWKKPPSPPKSGAQTASREELIAKAKKDLAAARAELGEENIAKMKAMVLAQQQREKQTAAPQPFQPPKADATPADRARELIKTMDKAKLADYIRTLSREDE